MMAESKIELTHRLQREGRWNEASEFRDKVRSEQREAGRPRAEANEEAWSRMAEKFPPLEDPKPGNKEMDDPFFDEVNDSDLPPNLSSGDRNFESDLLWAYHNIDSVVRREDAPSGAAWLLRQWGRDRSTTDKFLNWVAKTHLRNRDKDERMRDDGRRQFELLSLFDDIREAHPKVTVAEALNRRTKRAPNGITLVVQNNSRARLTRLANECGFRVLSDMRSEVLDRWMRDRLADGMTPANLNEFRNELVIFANWCIRNKRLLVNPVNDVPKLDATANPGRKRRSMTEAELVKLLRVARWRPLAEFGRLSVNKQAEDDNAASAVTEGKSKRRKWTYSALTLDDLEAAVDRARERLKGNPEFIAQQERLGEERALIFKTLVLTGLRKGELAAVTVGHFEHNGPMPVIVMNSDQTKNRQRAEIPLRADLADDLRKWLGSLHNARHGVSDTSGERIALTFQRDAGDALPLDTRLFRVPKGLVRILNRDLKTAGISKRDERGRTIDVHALRHSFGTLLSKGGVAPRTAQAAMRHSTIDLTMNTYTDPKLLDVQGALDSLPSLPLGSHPNGKEKQRAQATGTEGASNWPPDLVAATVAVATGFRGHSESFPVIASENADRRMTRNANDETLAKSSEKALFAGFANKAFPVERKGVEPSTSALRTQRSPN